MVLKLPESTETKAFIRRVHRPRTKLGKITLWFGMLAGLLELSKVIFRSPSDSILSGWTTFLAYIFFLCVAWMLLRYTRRKLMWRLRNRLIVTYIFIGVIPILLFAMMGALGGYLFAGQFATYIAMENLRSELRHLESANSSLARQYRHLGEGGKLNWQVANEIASASEENFLQRSVSVWEEDKAFVIPADDKGVKRDPFKVSPKIEGDFAGIVMDRDQMRCRAVKRLREGEKELVVISDVPITARLLRKAAAQLGSTTLLPPGEVVEDTPTEEPKKTSGAPAPKSANGINPSPTT